MGGPTFTIDPSPTLPDKPMKDPSVGVDIVGAKASYQGAQTLAGISFGFGAEARASIEAFNSKDDKDQDGVLGLPIKDDTTFEVTLPPQLDLTEEDAWLKYRYSAALKASASGTPAPVEFSLDFSKEAVFTDFHVHSRNDNARTAVLADITQLRFAANLDDILALKAKEAVSYQVRGRLFASVTVSWSDVFTASLTSLSQFLKAGKMLALKITPAASVTFHVELLDDFMVVFRKAGDNKVRVAVKKTDSRELGVSASIGITVKFADEKAVEEALNNVLQSFAGEQVSAIDNILNKATLGDLTDAQRRIVDELVQRLGLEDVAHSLQDIKKRWEALKDSVNGKIKEVAKAKVALGFTYDYLRVRTEDSLLIADVDALTLKRFHNELMLCNFRNLLDWVAGNPASLVKYLNQTKLKRTHAWGFSLAIGPWNIGGKDKRELTSIVQRNIKGDERIAYQGLRGYESEWVGNKAAWNVDFKAQLEEYAKAGTATARQFKYGLHFKWAWDEKKLDKGELQTFLDYAVIWRIITQDNAGEIMAMLEADVDNSAQVSQELTLDDDALRALLPLAATAVDGDLPVIALAKAMPYMKMYEGRRSPANREAIYAPLWKYYFQNATRPINTFPLIAAQDVEQIAQLKHIADGPGLALRERGTSSTMPAYQDFYTFSGQLYYHGQTPNDYSGIHQRWLSFASGMKKLNEALKPGNDTPHKNIEEIFGLLARFWGQSLYVRAAGIFLTDLAATDKSLLGKANRSLTISFAGGDVHVFTASA